MFEHLTGKSLSGARDNEQVLVSHDLDFSAILAASDADAPSVIQIRTHDLDVDRYGPLLVAVATQERELLNQDALRQVTLRQERHERFETDYRQARMPKGAIAPLTCRGSPPDPAMRA